MSFSETKPDQFYEKENEKVAVWNFKENSQCTQGVNILQNLIRFFQNFMGWQAFKIKWSIYFQINIYMPRERTLWIFLSTNVACLNFG